MEHTQRAEKGEETEEGGVNLRKRFVWFSCSSIRKPILEIQDRSDQVQIRLIPYGAEHITIHLKDGSLIKNYSVGYTVEPQWKDDVNHIARDIEKWPHWNKHDKYVFNNVPLVKFSNMGCYHLLGRRIDLDKYEPKSKYLKQFDLEIKVPHPQFLLNIYLSTSDNPYDCPIGKIDTTLGDICFAIEN